jgi:hypothetical protein
MLRRIRQAQPAVNRLSGAIHHLGGPAFSPNRCVELPSPRQICATTFQTRTEAIERSMFRIDRRTILGRPGAALEQGETRCKPPPVVGCIRSLRNYVAIISPSVYYISLAFAPQTMMLKHYKSIIISCLTYPMVRLLCVPLTSIYKL